jgi:hypothetical protein
MPDWSPDGNPIVFVRIPADGKPGSYFNNSPYAAGDRILG